MNLHEIKQAYFLGIGGIGMSAIARYFHSLGIKVNGYDRTETPLTRELEADGMDVHYTDLGKGVELIVGSKSETLVVLTPAIPKDHAEWNWLQSEGYSILKRSQVLGLITDAYRTIGVAGTHGKTTTSTLIAHILKQSHVDCAAFLGGISSNYGTNLLLHSQSGSAPKASQNMVVEADEFDRSFLTLHPSIAIITSTDADHLDIYGKHEALKESFLAYAHQCIEDGKLIVKKGLDIIPELRRTYLTYSVEEPADFYAKNIRIEGAHYHFDLDYKGKTISGLHLGVPGLHNVENAVAASAAALLSGVTENELRTALANFNGVKRRFEYIVKRPDFVYIDDYAHHPEELRAIISSVRNMYPGKKIVGAFQPHLFSRTRDFVDGFAESLSLLEDVVLLDIYPARELPIEGVTSHIIFDKITSPVKQLCSKEQALNILMQKQADVLLTLGAGDIDTLVEPLRTFYTRSHGI